MATANPCRSTLESALGRTLSDQEFKKIEADFKIASKDAAKAFGKGFSNQPANVRAKLISDQLNLNRAKSLTSLENQLLANANITSLTNLGSTLGKDLSTISAKELADNIDNMIGTDPTRKSYLGRGGDAKNFDTVRQVFGNRLARVWFGVDNARLKDFDAIYGTTGTTVDSKLENALADRILNDKQYMEDFYQAINDLYMNAGLNTRVDKLNISLSREDIITLTRNNGMDIDAAAKAFEASVNPLLANGNTVNLQDLFKAALSKGALIDASGVSKSGAELLRDLKFKDGESYMTFLKMYSKQKDLANHVNNTISQVSADLAKYAIFKNENIVDTIDRKIKQARESGVENEAISKLENTKRAYQEHVEGTLGKDFDDTILDLSIQATGAYVRATYLGTSGIKGVVTDKIGATMVMINRGDFGAAIDYNTKAISEAVDGFSVKDLDTFYVGLDEFMTSTQHYMSRDRGGIADTDSWVRGKLKRGRDIARNLATKIQIVQGVHRHALSTKRSLGKMLEKQMFDPTYNTSLRDSYSVETHATVVKLGIKDLKGLNNLDMNTYNTKMGTTLDQAGFDKAKADLSLDVEAAIMHQINALQIDSGSVSSGALISRLMGSPSGFARRYVAPLFNQFGGYSINFALKHQLIRDIYNADTISGRARNAGVFVAYALIAGYFNANIGGVLRDGVDHEWVNPISDIASIASGDSEAAMRVATNLANGSSLPGLKQIEGSLKGQSIEKYSPSLGFITGLVGAIYDVITDPTDPEAQSQLIKKALPFNLPGLKQGIDTVREQITGVE